MDTSDPRKLDDKVIMRPDEEGKAVPNDHHGTADRSTQNDKEKSEDRYKHYDPARRPAENEEEEAVTEAVTHMQAADQNREKPLEFDEVRDSLRETPEEVREAEAQMGEYQKWDDGAMKADGEKSKLD